MGSTDNGSVELRTTWGSIIATGRQIISLVALGVLVIIAYHEHDARAREHAAILAKVVEVKDACLQRGR